MKIVDVIIPQAVCVDLKAKTKEEALSELVDLLVKSGGIKSTEKSSILTKLKEREVLGSTGIGKGVGIPHAKCSSIKKMVAALGVSKSGVDFKSLDGEMTYIFFLLVAPGDTPGPHLKALARISRLLDDKFIRERLRAGKSVKEMLKILEDEDKKFPQ